ncbi:hypothetical protein BGZ54_003771 [Gamsiella multidivaricata]|nr:hypothetical protein BGZ54_003771 [Gamsiella multidivaricata]
MTSSSSAPRRPVYPSNDGDDDNEITEAPLAEGSSSSSSEINPSASSSSAAATATARRNSGVRTTNRSFLARLTGRQRPERDARRMIQSTMDGVFSNLSAKPRVEKPYEEELPPSYKSAAQDVSPAYYESTVLSPGFIDDDDMLLIEGLPVGGLFGFMWNMIISMSFQFVGFCLTYLLHTSHATKQGSKTGLGITFVTMGFNIMNGKFSEGDIDGDPMEDSDTGYMGDTGPSTSLTSLRSMTEYIWLSYFLVMLGIVIIAQSLVSFAKAKRTEMIMLATNSAALEAAVPANAAAGQSVPSFVSTWAALAGVATASLTSTSTLPTSAAAAGTMAASESAPTGATTSQSAGAQASGTGSESRSVIIPIA